ncbi:MAG: acetylserotonin O-methyltransferase [Chloroflexota bacterium]|nr:acetylserotonin O-methyltransferase [Chloroflexota bacterium]
MAHTPVTQESSTQLATAEQQAALLRLMGGARVTQMLHIAAKLGIADLLAEGLRNCDELARLTDTHAPSLYRALRVLATVGIFAEVGERAFELTPLAQLLRSDAPGSARNYVIMQGEPWMWQAWGDAMHSVRTGEPAFEHVHGIDFFGYLAREPEAAVVFNAAMTGRAGMADVTVARAYDFSDAGVVCDVGGGHGVLLTTILEAHPGVRGILFDQPAVIDGARARIDAAGLAGRCDLVAGDFFEAVPAGADVYVMSNVIHDWDDERALVILRSCHQAMAPGGRLLIVETLIPPGNEPHFGKMVDVQMLVLTGGGERTEAEYRALLAAAGFRPTRVIPTPSTVSIIEGIRD